MKSLKINSVLKLLVFLVGLSTLSIKTVVAGEPFMLVSEEEYLQQLDQQHALPKKKKIKLRSIFGTDQNAPSIIVNSPSISFGLYSPISIKINFKAQDGANIQPESLKVLYGWLNLDITDRIRQNAEVSSSGISADNVEMPVGKHKLTLEIMDSQNRSSEKGVSIEILEPDNS